MRPLSDSERKRFLTWSALLCAIPLCLAPLAGRSSFELAGEQAAFDARFSPPQLQNVWNDKPVSISRDPFVPEAPAATAQATYPTSASVVGMQVTQGQSMGFTLPANRGAAGTPLAGANGPLTVTAVVTGPSPRALVDDGGRVRVVGVGDTLSGSVVASIDGFGVRLRNGMLLPLSEEDRL